MTKIESLTLDQKALLPAFRSEWFAHGVSTERANRAEAEAAILAMRVEIGVTAKPVFIWCESPATSLLALHVLKSAQWKKFVRDLPGQIPELTRDSLWDSLGASLRDSLGASLRASLGDSLVSEWWGQHESYWIAFYLF